MPVIGRFPSSYQDGCVYHVQDVGGVLPLCGESAPVAEDLRGDLPPSGVLCGRCWEIAEEDFAQLKAMRKEV